MVERAGLENRNTRKRIVGSNPTLSANEKTTLVVVFSLWNSRLAHLMRTLRCIQ